MADNQATRPSRRPRRALPGWAIDMIRDGVPASELEERGQRAVWDELGRTALAAVNAGYSRVDWEFEVVRPSSRLGLQNRLKANGKERTAQAANKALHSAWDRAERRALDSPAWTKQRAREEAERRATALLLLAADPDVQLTVVQRDLLEYAANKAARQWSVSVNLPRAATAKDVGHGEKAVRLHLDRLADLGLLCLSERGRARTKNRPGGANVYKLPDEDGIDRAITSLSRETRQVGPSAQAGRPSALTSTGPEPAAPRAYQPAQGPPVSATGIALKPVLRDQAEDLRRRTRDGLKELFVRSLVEFTGPRREACDPSNGT